MRAFWIILVFVLSLPFMAAAQADNQTDERDLLTAFLEDNLSGAGRTVTVTGFSGAFSSQAQIQSLSIADTQGVWLTLNNVTLDWSRASLLLGVVDVTELTADEVIVARKPLPDPNAIPAPEATGFALPELPVSIEINTLSAKRIVLDASVLGQRIEGSFAASAKLKGGDGSADLSLTRVGEGPDGQLALKIAYNNTTKQLNLDLDLTEEAEGIAASLLDLPGKPSVALKIAGAGPLDDFIATLDLRTDGQERLAGEVTLKGSDDGAQSFVVNLNGDVAPLFLPDYAEFFGTEVAFKAEGQRKESGQLDLSALALKTRALSLDGAATIATDGLPQKFTLVGRLGLPSGEPILLPFGGADETRVASADLRVGFDATKGDGWNAAVTVTDVARADVAVGTASIKGSGRINRRAGSGGTIIGGTLVFGAEDVALTDQNLAAALGQAVDGKLVFDWQKGGLGFRIGKLELTEGGPTPGYKITTSARIADLESGFRTRGSIEAEYNNLSRLSPLAGRALGGKGAFRISGQISPLGGEFDAVGKVKGTNITLGIVELDNLLKGASEIEFAAARSKQGTFLRSLNITAQQLVATAKGKLASDGSDLKGTVSFADLSSLGDKYGGSLQADATFSGTPENGRITLDGIGNALKIGQAQADALIAGQSRLSVAIGVQGQRLTLEKAEIANPQINADATGYIDPTGSDVTANLALPNLSPLGAGYRGALQAVVTAKGTLEAGRAELAGQGTNLAIGNAPADSLLRGKSVVNAAVNLRDRRLVVESATVSNPQITAKATGTVTDDVRQVQLEARLANLALLVPDFPGAVTVAGSVVENGNGMTLDLKGTGPGGIDARVAGRVAPNFRGADLAITGSAQAALANAFLGPRSISGQARFDLRLNGLLALSSLSGTGSLTGGRFSAPNLPFGLQDIASTVTLGGNQLRLNMTSAPSTGGSLAVEGTIGLAAPNPTDLAVTLRNATLKDPDLYNVSLGGDVTIKGPLAGGAVIGGAVNIREAELRVPTSGFSSIGSLPGLKHKNEPAAVKQTRYKAGLIDLGGGGKAANARSFGLNLVISAPSRIFLRGRGIDAEFGGRVMVRGDTNTVIPSGAFELIRGRLEILGKRLDLTEAQLLLQGDLIPYISIVATNEGENVTTSVNIKGRADDPEITFTSTPDLPQEEVLAQLLFGRDLTSISALQAAQLASAVASLAGKGGEGIVGSLRKSFGLDDLDLSTDADGNVSVKAGKYLSKRVYTEVEVDQNGQSKINLNLDLKKNVTVRGSVGADGTSALGVFIEKDY
ncbi:translocation/assembly module TamB domain-containing protein [Pseudorhodobacter ferrugineus]|uniref:translocation/assembly module TamB domain-containing protein n=1 Tax=Pseudorhodobacter ferrugineus TaxID=77008 RepID=UPI0003B61D20|nr:translocation/assembly module TamB domain-containing protein [Pseudorhodobacter ferrugineus]